MVKKNAPPEDAETKPAHPRHYRGSMDTQRERVGCLSEITTAVSLSGVLAETGREAGDAWSDCQG